MHDIARFAILVPLLAALAAPALACEVPDEGGDTPWRRAVSKVKYLPQTEAWAELQSRDRNLVQYVVLLDEPRRRDGLCWWPVEVRADGKLWKRFLVTPDGARIAEEGKR